MKKQQPRVKSAEDQTAVPPAVTLSRHESLPYPVAGIGGVVITFADITGAKTLEMELREENARVKRLLGSGV